MTLPKIERTTTNASVVVGVSIGSGLIIIALVVVIIVLIRRQQVKRQGDTPDMALSTIRQNLYTDIDEDCNQLIDTSTEQSIAGSLSDVHLTPLRLRDNATPENVYQIM